MGEVAQLRQDRVAVERLENKGAVVVHGSGRIAGPGRVVVGDREFVARRGIVLNTGTSIPVG